LFFPAFSTPSTLPFDVRQELAISATALANLVEAVAAASSRAHIVFPSTGGAIYGNSETPCTEQTPVAPESSYAFGKLISEEILKFYARLGKISFTILRFSNLYGCSGRRVVPQGVIDRFLDDALEEKVSSVWVEPSSTRDYLFVDDAAKAISAILDDPAKGRNVTFNVASGNSTSMREILLMIRRVTDGRHEFKCENLKYGGVRHIAIDTSGFRKAYPEWDVLTPIDEGITITWRRKLVRSSGLARRADIIGG
jgi:UDP-glucose 4-epimerase